MRCTHIFSKIVFFYYLIQGKIIIFTTRSHLIRPVKIYASEKYNENNTSNEYNSAKSIIQIIKDNEYNSVKNVIKIINITHTHMHK